MNGFEIAAICVFTYLFSALLASYLFVRYTDIEDHIDYEFELFFVSIGWPISVPIMIVYKMFKSVIRVGSKRRESKRS